jgi:hypothetical protein
MKLITAPMPILRSPHQAGSSRWRRCSPGWHCGELPLRTTGGRFRLPRGISVIWSFLGTTNGRPTNVLTCTAVSRVDSALVRDAASVCSIDRRGIGALSVRSRAFPGAAIRRYYRHPAGVGEPLLRARQRRLRLRLARRPAVGIQIFLATPFGPLGQRPQLSLVTPAFRSVS